MRSTNPLVFKRQTQGFSCIPTTLLTLNSLAQRPQDQTQARQIPLQEPKAMAKKEDGR